MAATKVNYDASTPIGAEMAHGVDLLRRGYDSIYRAKVAIDAATDGGNDKDALTGSDFGAATSADAILMWDAMYTLKFVLDNATSGGLLTSIGDLDKGVSA